MLGRYEKMPAAAEPIGRPTVAQGAQPWDNDLPQLSQWKLGSIGNRAHVATTPALNIPNRKNQFPPPNTSQGGARAACPMIKPIIGVQKANLAV